MFTETLLPAGPHERVALPGLGYRLLARDEAAGAWSLGVHDLAPRTLGAPTHVHEHEDEHSYVLSGRLGAQVGDRVVDAGPGDVVVKPRRVPHAFWNAGDEPVVFLEVISPAGFERYFADLAPLLAAGAPDPAAIGAVQQRYALTMDFSTVGGLVAAHGLEPVPGI